MIPKMHNGPGNPGLSAFSGRGHRLPGTLDSMVADGPEKKAWLANAAEANDFALRHGGEAMSAENRAIYDLMLRRTADAQSVHDVIEAAARIVARADGYGMSVTGSWLVGFGIALTYLGAIWLVLYDVSGGDLPVAALGDGNTTLGLVVLIPGVALWVTGSALRRSGRRRAHR